MAEYRYCRTFIITVIPVIAESASLISVTGDRALLITVTVDDLVITQ